MNQLRHMSIFAHIVETGSISAAATTLNLSKSVISQHLKSLERELGVTLLKRTTRRQTLTFAGKKFYEKCKQINDIASLAWDTAQESADTPKGHIRITAPNALMEVLITPVIGELLQQYPELDPELISNDHVLNVSENNIDLAIRVGHSQNSNLKQKRIGEFRDVLCKATTAFTAHNLENIPYISNAWQGKNIVHKFTRAQHSPIHYQTKARCVTHSFYSCLSLIESGAGMGIIPDFHLQLMQPKLQAVLPNHQLAISPVYAIHPFTTQVPLSVSTCLNAIAQQLLKVT